MAYRTFCHRLRKRSIPLKKAHVRGGLCDVCHHWDTKEIVTITQIKEELVRKCQEIDKDFFLQWEVQEALVQGAPKQPYIIYTLQVFFNGHDLSSLFRVCLQPFPASRAGRLLLCLRVFRVWALVTQPQSALGEGFGVAIIQFKCVSCLWLCGMLRLEVQLHEEGRNETQAHNPIPQEARRLPEGRRHRSKAEIVAAAEAERKSRHAKRAQLKAAKAARVQE